VIIKTLEESFASTFNVELKIYTNGSSKMVVNSYKTAPYDNPEEHDILRIPMFLFC
jgi:hypothetical protein